MGPYGERLSAHIVNPQGVTMTTARKTTTAQTLKTIAELGQSAGVWTIKSHQCAHMPFPNTEEEDASAWRYVEVECPDGLPFSLSVGGWREEGRIGARVGYLTGPDGKVMGQQDTKARNLPDTRITITADQLPAIAVKAIKRRLIDSPNAREVAQAVVDHTRGLFASASALDGHVETMKGLGFRGWDQERSAYERRMTHSLPCLHGVRVNQSGNVYLDHLTVPVDKMAALVALLAP